MKKWICSGIAGLMLAGCQTAKAADYYTYTNVHVFTYSPGDGTGWPAWLAFSQINTNFGWISNVVWVASNTLHQARLNSTNDLAAALTANLNGASNVLRQARIDSTNDLSAVLAANLNSASNVLYELIGEGGGVSWNVASNLSYEVSKTATNSLMGTVQTLINAKMYSPGTQPPAYFWASPADAYGTLVPRQIVGTDLPGYLATWASQALGYLGSYATKPLTDFQPVLATGSSEHQVLAWHSGSPGAYYPHTTLLTLDGLTGDAVLNYHTATNFGSVNREAGEYAFTAIDYANSSGSLALVAGTQSTDFLTVGGDGVALPQLTASRVLATDADSYITTTSVTPTKLNAMASYAWPLVPGTGTTVTTNADSYAVNVTAASGSLLQGSTVNMPTDGTATTLYTITGIPDNSAFTVTGIVSVKDADSATYAGGDMMGVGIKSGGTITMLIGETLTALQNSLSSDSGSGGYANSGGDLKVSITWNKSIGTAHAKWSGYINIVQ